MAEGQGKPSSPLDDMLAAGRLRLDALSRRAPSSAAPQPEAAPAATGDPASPALRRLAERFGNDWRYEVLSRQIEGDEAIVMLRLTAGKDLVRTQFGRAKLAGGAVAGTSGGIAFRLGGDASGDVGDAYRRAVEAALMRCAELV
jgi:hypothetical protein